MIRTFRGTVDLSADEASAPGAIDTARQEAFAQARAEAIAACGCPQLPQDHSLEDADHRTGDGGHHVEVVLTLDL